MEINIMNVCEQFFKYYEAAKDKEFTVKARLWKELYQEPNKDVFDNYLGLMHIVDKSFKLEDRYEFAFEGFEKYIEDIKKSNSTINEDILHMGEKCKKLFTVSKEERVSIDFIVFVALFISDGWISEFKGKPTGFFAAELLYEGNELSIFLAHEITHNIHMQLTNIEDKCTLAENLFLEGVAVAASEVLAPGETSAKYIYFAAKNPEEIVGKCIEGWDFAKEDIRANLETISDEYAAKYFGGPTGNEKIPPRAGYVYGYNAVKKLLKEYSFEEMLRWPSERVIEEIKVVIEEA